MYTLLADIDGESFGVKLSEDFYTKYEEQLDILLKDEYFFDWYSRGSLINEWAMIYVYIEDNIFTDEAHMVLLPLIEKATEKGYVELAKDLEDLL